MARKEKEALILLLAAALAAPASQAIVVENLDVRYRDGRYIVEFTAWLDAPADKVGAVLLDFERYPQLDPRILESRRIESSDASRPLLKTRLRGCVGALLCRSMGRVEALQLKPGELIATAIPEQSDVRFGETRSRWRARDEGTQVSYRLEIVPDFWVPPMIGRRMMLRTMRDGTLDLFHNVEKAARRRAVRD